MMKLAKSLLVIAVFALPAAALADGAACKNGKADKYFSEMDPDKDGTVSKEEFRAMADKHFDAMDTDHDGTLTKEELMAGSHGMMRTHMRNSSMMKDSKQ
jgi:Ca2+-binding EF-hand superfamily protein